MAEMVFCQSCLTVIWAYDHQHPVDMRGIANHLSLPCPKCGGIGNFDGYGKDGGDWLWLRDLAKANGLAWEISPDCGWFRRPEMSLEEHYQLLRKISNVICAMGLAEEVK